MITEEEAKQFIRMTLRQWGVENVSVELNPKLASPKDSTWGCFYWTKNKIEIATKTLQSFPSFKHVFYHELAHALDYRERGSLFVNGRLNGHGASFNKWCKKLGIPKGRFIPINLLPIK